MLTPWTVEEGTATFVVRTAKGIVVSVTYFDDSEERAFNLRKEEARRIAVAISRLPELLGKTDKTRSGPGALRRTAPRPPAAGRRIIQQ